MHALKQKLGARGLRVISVTEVDPDDLEDERADVREAAAEHHIDYPTLLDADARWMESVGITGVPSFLVVGRDGKLTYRYRGAVRPGSDAFGELEAAVERALDGP